MNNSPISSVSNKPTSSINQLKPRGSACSLLKTALRVSAFVGTALLILPYWTQKPNECRSGTILGIASTEVHLPAGRVLALYNYCPPQAESLEERRTHPRTLTNEADSDSITQPSDSMTEQLKSLMSKKNASTVAMSVGASFVINVGLRYAAGLAFGCLRRRNRQADGSIYNGSKTYTYPDGSTYEGERLNGKRHGKGTQRFPNGECYKGDWVNGMREGHGFVRYVDGSTYEGQWKNNDRNGFGIDTYFNGCTYRGERRNGQKHGFGTFTDIDGSTYEGNWVDGQEHGKGTHRFPNGECYEGDWVNGMREGYGVVTYVDGSTYEGQWKNNDRNGLGIDTYFNGCTYKGERRNGQKHGFGTFTDTDGSTYEGNWLDGQEHGEQTFTTSDGYVYAQDWVLGTLKSSKRIEEAPEST